MNATVAAPEVPDGPSRENLQREVNLALSHLHSQAPVVASALSSRTRQLLANLFEALTTETAREQTVDQFMKIIAHHRDGQPGEAPISELTERHNLLRKIAREFRGQ